MSRRRAAAPVRRWHQYGPQLGATVPCDRQRDAEQMSGQKRKPIPGEHRTWLLRRIKDRDFRLRGLVAELAKRRSVTVEVTKDFVWNSAIGPQTAQRCARDGRSPFG